MAGSPIKRARLEALDEQEETIFALLEDGRAKGDIAKTVGCSRPFLDKWINRSDERRKRFEESRAQAGDSIADQSLITAQETYERAKRGEASKTEIQAAKLLADSQMRMAGVWNKKYAENNGSTNVAVNVDLGSAFLSALRRPVSESQVLPVDEVRQEPKALTDESLPDIEDSLSIHNDSIIAMEYVIEHQPVIKRDFDLGFDD